MDDKLKTIAEGTVEEARGVLEGQQKESQEKRENILDILDLKKSSIISYKSLLSDFLFKRLAFAVDWRGWTYKTAYTKEGVVMELYSPDKRIFRSAFRPTQEAKYDLFEIERFCDLAENTIDKYEQGRNNQQNS